MEFPIHLSYTLSLGCLWTTQMKALDEDLIMVVFTLLLNILHVFVEQTSFLCLIWTEKNTATKGLNLACIQLSVHLT